MKLRLIGCISAATCVAMMFASARASVVLSEVVYNEVGSDVTGEWIEIYNTGPLPVDLSNYKIGDEEASGQTSLTEALVRFPAGAIIPAGGIQIVAVSATRFFTVYGINPTYEVGSTDPTVLDMLTYTTWDPDGGAVNMSNSNDQAVLVDPMDVVIDAASWGNTFAFNPALDAAAAVDGQSYQRKNVLIDTNTASDWILGPTAAAARDRSTPFAVSVPEFSSFGLVAAVGLMGAFKFRYRRETIQRT